MRETDGNVSVWAPNAKSVELVKRGEPRIAMDRGERGWFSAPADVIADGDDYWFSLDGGPARPDPRARCQPDGPHGPSRWIDMARWIDLTRIGSSPFQPGEWADQVVYEMHVGTFSPAATFAGAVERLDHLVDLGVTAIEVMPIAEFPGDRGWGYDGVDLYAAHHGYGGPEGFADFVAACHDRRLAVILDVVYNHLGPDGNYLDAYGPYFTSRYATPWGAAVNYDDAHSDDVRRFVLDNARMWLRDFGCDGLRLDAVHAIFDTSAVHVVEQLAVEVDALARESGRSFWVIAETGQNDPRVVRERDRGGFGVTAQWNDDFHHALHVALTGEQTGYYVDFHGLVDVAAAIDRNFVYDGRYSSFRQRTHGRSARDLPRERFVVYAQNHDQVGNRATGDRLAHLVSVDRVKIAAALTLTSPFVPMLFQGEEWGASTPFQYFTDHRDPKLARAVSDGRRHEFASFGWAPDDVPDPQDPATYARSCLRWRERSEGLHRELFTWHRDLIALRRRSSALRAGAPAEVQCDEVAGVLVVRRGAFTIAANLGADSHTVAVDGVVVLASNDATRNAHGMLTLPSDSVAIVGPAD